MKIPIVPIAKWIGSTLITAALQEAVTRLATKQTERAANAAADGTRVEGAPA